MSSGTRRTRARAHTYCNFALVPPAAACMRVYTAASAAAHVPAYPARIKTGSREYAVVRVAHARARAGCSGKIRSSRERYCDSGPMTNRSSRSLGVIYGLLGNCSGYVCMYGGGPRSFGCCFSLLFLCKGLKLIMRCKFNKTEGALCSGAQFEG